MGFSLNTDKMSFCSLVVLLGPPGVGKGTLAHYCVSLLGFKTVSTGKIFRDQINENTALGQKVKAVIQAGQLVDDSLVNQVFADWLNRQDIRHPMLFDGYPRTVNQAHFLLNLLTEKNAKKDAKVFLMDASEKVVKDRILNRLICTNRQCGRIYTCFDESCLYRTCGLCDSKLEKRADDNAQVALKRLDDYLQIKDVLLATFKEAGLPIVTLETSLMSPEAVFEEFKRKVLCFRPD